MARINGMHVHDAGLESHEESRLWKIVRTAGVLFLLATGATALGLYLWVTPGEIYEERYMSYDEAEPAITRGWLPARLPTSATEIHEWHDLDTNLRLGSFRFDPEDRPSMELTLRQAMPSSVRIDRDPSFASPVSYDPSTVQLEELGFEFLSDEDLWFAINWNDGMAYFWGSEF